jgi:hypothetical protein
MDVEKTTDYTDFTEKIEDESWFAFQKSQIIIQGKDKFLIEEAKRRAICSILQQPRW